MGMSKKEPENNSPNRGGNDIEKAHEANAPGSPWPGSDVDAPASPHLDSDVDAPASPRFDWESLLDIPPSPHDEHSNGPGAFPPYWQPNPYQTYSYT